MSASRISRPPARFVYAVPQEGIFNRVSGKTAGQAAISAGDNYGRSSTTTLPFATTVLDVMQINPAHEQPRLDYTSGRQPFIRWGFRRFVRTFMASSPRFQGRWFYVGAMQRQYTERARMTGVPTRQGTSYVYPRMKVSPRTIPLGGAGSPR